MIGRPRWLSERRKMDRDHVRIQLPQKDFRALRSKLYPEPYKYRTANIQQLAEYLGKLRWDFFMTGSTGYELTLKSARRLAERYCNNLPSGSLLFWVAEKFECKDGYHIHGLVQLSDSGLRRSKRSIAIMGQLWQVATGNKCLFNHSDEIRWEIWNQIDNSPYIKGVGAAGYCAKYINKKKADYDLLISLNDC